MLRILSLILVVACGGIAQASEEDFQDALTEETGAPSGLTALLAEEGLMAERNRAEYFEAIDKQGFYILVTGLGMIVMSLPTVMEIYYTPGKWFTDICLGGGFCLSCYGLKKAYDCFPDEADFNGKKRD